MTPIQSIRTALRKKLAGGARPLRFLIAGGINTLFGLALYPLLLWSVPALHRHYMIGLVIAQAVSLCFAFMTYKITVFQTRANAAREFGAFSSFYIVNYALNWLALPALVDGARIDPIPAQIGFSILFVVGSYFWHSRVTFRSSRES